MKLKAFAPLLMIGAFFTVTQNEFNVLAGSGYGGGSGTMSDPYLISTPEHLNQLQLDVNVNGVDTWGKYYQLTTNIDLSGYDNDSDTSNGNFSPIGYYKSTGNRNYFKGTFDGNGHTISNIEILLPDQDYVGFFGYTSSATIQNLGLKNVVIEGGNYVGGLVGFANNLTINQSYFLGDVVGNQYVGGIVGSLQQSTLAKSYVIGNIDGGSYLGGLVGYYNDSSMNESYASTTINSSATSYVGPLVGRGDYNKVTITNSYWDVEKSRKTYSESGGFGVRSQTLSSDLASFVMKGFDFENVWSICENRTPMLKWESEACQSVEQTVISLDGNGTSDDPYLIQTARDLYYVNQLIYHLGGFESQYYNLTSNIDFSGWDTDEDITNGNWKPLGDSLVPFKGFFDGKGHVISNLKIILPTQDYVGFFGATDEAIVQNIKLENIIVQGNKYVGGLSGSNQSIYGGKNTITQSGVVGTVSGVSSVGGLVGQNGGEMQRNYSMGEVNGEKYVGGLVGYNADVITESYANSNVNGIESVGGLIGYTWGTTLSKSYASGMVNGDSFVGGALGDQNRMTVDQVYSSTQVVGTSTVGGLVGNSKWGTFTNSYWDIESSGQNSSQGGIGLTTKQMTKRKAKENMTGFDFDTVWQESKSYPLLYWQTPNPITEQEEDVIINGTIKETILSLTVPSNSMTFVLNPNEELAQQFIASDFSLVNEGHVPLTLELGAFEQITNVLNDVVPTKYSDWNGLNKLQSKDIALALAPKTGDGWLSLNKGDRWVADLGDTEIGTIKGNSTVSFGFKAKHGSAFSETLTPQYRLTFIFGLQD